MDLDLLPALVALADHGTLAEAGRALGLTQPAVHQRIGRLQDAVGVPLVRREGRRLALTDAGRELVALGRRTAGDARKVLARVRGEAPEPPTVIAGRGVWLRRVGALPACRPVVGDGATAVAMVRDGRARLGVAAVPLPDDLRGRDLWTVRERVLVPTSDPLASAGALRWGDLRGRALVLPPRGRALRERAESLAGPLSAVVDVEGWDLLTRFVVLGAGLTVINEDVPAPEGTVLVPLLDGAAVTYRALWRRGDDPRALLDALGLTRWCSTPAT